MQNDVNILKATVYPEVCLLNHMVVLLVIFFGSHHTVFPSSGSLCGSLYGSPAGLNLMSLVKLTN